MVLTRSFVGSPAQEFPKISEYVFVMNKENRSGPQLMDDSLSSSYPVAYGLCRARLPS